MAHEEGTACDEETTEWIYCCPKMYTTKHVTYEKLNLVEKVFYIGVLNNNSICISISSLSSLFSTGAPEASLCTPYFDSQSIQVYTHVLFVSSGNKFRNGSAHYASLHPEVSPIPLQGFQWTLAVRCLDMVAQWSSLWTLSDLTLWSP